VLLAVESADQEASQDDKSSSKLRIESKQSMLSASSKEEESVNSFDISTLARIVSRHCLLLT